MGHPEVGQVAGHLGGVLQPEARVHLQPVGARRHLTTSSAAGRDHRPPVSRGHSAGPLKTTIERPSTVTVSPGLRSFGSTSPIADVSITGVHAEA